MPKTKLSTHWKQKDGTLIKIADMTDVHLSNAIKMLGRTWKNKVDTNKQFKSLQAEAQNRGFKVTILFSPIKINNTKEYIDVFIPTPRSRISPALIATDWDSRPQE